MGPVGLPEMAVIFVIALVLFGPKKLPELGRMLGTAIGHFRRVRSELKATFDRELQNLEMQARFQNVSAGYRSGSGRYDYSSTSIGSGLVASSAPEGRDSTITRVDTTDELARPAGDVHESSIGVDSGQS